MARVFREIYGIQDQRVIEFSWDPHNADINGNNVTNYGCYWCRLMICQTPIDPTKPTGVGNEDNEYWKDDSVINGQPDCDCKPIGGYTYDDDWIQFASLSSNPLRKVNNVIHELGHAFNSRIGGAGAIAVNAAITTKDLPEKRPYGFYEAGSDGDLIMTWIQSPTNSGTEIFADQFLGWVRGKWADDAFGHQRRDFMNTKMPNWIQQAKAAGPSQ